ncbi:MAG TPA: hypothetical protein VGM77_11170 [Gemmatimonadales bacterium]|jgi:hypothetical protein
MYAFDHQQSDLPREIVAGDSVCLTFRSSQALSGWLPTLYINGASRLQVTGTTTNDAFLITIPASKSANLLPGAYGYTLSIAQNDERLTIAQGILTVAENPATAVPKLVHVERMVRCIDDVIAGRITDDVQSFAIAGKNLTSIPILELHQLRAVYAKELYALKYGPGSIRHQVSLRFEPVGGR